MEWMDEILLTWTFENADWFTRGFLIVDECERAVRRRRTGENVLDSIPWGVVWKVPSRSRVHSQREFAHPLHFHSNMNWEQDNSIVNLLVDCWS